MTLKTAETSAIGWRDLVIEGRLPRFALVCAGTWLGAADELMTATAAFVPFGAAACVTARAALNA